MQNYDKIVKIPKKKNPTEWSPNCLFLIEFYQMVLLSNNSTHWRWISKWWKFFAFFQVNLKKKSFGQIWFYILSPCQVWNPKLLFLYLCTFVLLEYIELLFYRGKFSYFRFKLSKISNGLAIIEVESILVSFLSENFFRNYDIHLSNFYL